MSDNEDNLVSTEAAASGTYPKQAGTIRKGDYIVIKGRPCKVVEVSTDDDAKCHFVAMDIFTDNELEDVVPSSDNCEVPVVERLEYQLIHVSSEDGTVCQVDLLDDSGVTKEDLKLPADDALALQMESGFEEGKIVFVTVMSAMGEEQIIAVKEAGDAM